MTRPLASAPAWALYRGATRLLELGALPFLRWRMRRGKEDPARLAERLGRTLIDRPQGTLVWMHGASVGEGLALLPLVERLRERGAQVLLTTGTVTSARVLATRLPPGAIHQFVPLDGPRAAHRFLERWHPHLAIFAESDLWPNLLGALQRRRIPAVLVNARLSARSFGRWHRAPALARPLLESLTLILAQSEADAARYATLTGHAVEPTGNLKFDAEPPPADDAALSSLSEALGERPVWIAASTHAGEDLACCTVHQTLAGRVPGLLTIVIPRHVDRAPAILAEAQRLGLATAARSQGAAPAARTALYVADTMGELGLFYRLKTVVFVGKSLVPGGGGQNPIEPAKLGNAVLHGPHVANFADIYAQLDAGGGGYAVADGAELAAAIYNLLTDRERLTAQAAAAERSVAMGAGVADRILDRIAPLLPAPSTRAA